MMSMILSKLLIEDESLYVKKDYKQVNTLFQEQEYWPYWDY